MNAAAVQSSASRESRESAKYTAAALWTAERRREEENEKSDGRENQRPNEITMTVYSYIFFFQTKQRPDTNTARYDFNIRKTLLRRRSEYIDGGFFRCKRCALRRRWPPLLDDGRNRWYASVGVTIGRDRVMRCNIIIIITVDESVGGWWGPGGPNGILPRR